MKYEKSILSEEEQYRAALSRCHLSESTMPISRGYLVENVDCYNKITHILNTKEMENCHKFCYNLDVEDLSESDIEKINNLYKLGKERGFINEDDDDDENKSSEEDKEDDKISKECDLNVMDPEVNRNHMSDNIPTSSYTIFYSAMKDGEIKTGECFSDGISPKTAKIDALVKLTKLGYSGISILAIEVSDIEDDSEDDSIQFNEPCGDCDIAGKAFGMGSMFEADDEEKEPETKEDVEPKKEDPNKDKEEDVEEEPEEIDVDNVSDKANDGEEIDAGEKTALTNQYKRAFKQAMIKSGFEVSFDELNIDDKVKFFTNLLHTWANKADPSKFMTPKETEALNKLKFKQ